jgi:hypothetical protein
MNRFLLVLLLCLAGCDFDSGASSYTKEFGRHIKLSCFMDNLNLIEGYSVTVKSESEYTLHKEGVEIVLEIERSEDELTGYSLKTSMEKSKDRDIHDKVKVLLFKGC